MVATKFAYLVAMFSIAAMNATSEPSTERVLESQIHFFSTTSELSPKPTSQPPTTL